MDNPSYDYRMKMSSNPGSPPQRPTCSEDPDRCTWVTVAGHDRCLEHLNEKDRIAEISRLRPGSTLYVRGHTISDDLLTQLRDQVSEPGSTPRLSADFDGATFEHDLNFQGWCLGSFTSFRNATFFGNANFDHVEVEDNVHFDDAEFAQSATFFEAVFQRDVWFERTKFGRQAWFTGARFKASAWFSLAHFASGIVLGPMSVGRDLILDGASFTEAIRAEIVARHISCEGLELNSGGELRLRFATVNLEDARCGAPLLLAPANQPFRYYKVEGETVALLEEDLAGAERLSPMLLSLRGVNASNIRLVNIDLSECSFAGADQLDKLYLEGKCTFARPPTNKNVALIRQALKKPFSTVRWSSRQVIAEEHYWRATTRKGQGWTAKPPQRSKGSLIPIPLSEDEILGPDRLDGLYRDLRKAYEDRKNEPGAADFYYGEMEMRRLDATTSLSERVILTIYWAISGYGLRAARAICWLAAVIIVSSVAFTFLGFSGAEHTIYQPVTSSGSATGPPSYQAVSTPGPKPGWTAAVDFSIDSAISLLRVPQSPPPLNTWGRLIEIILRLAGPVLLALAVLAVRARVRR